MIRARVLFVLSVVALAPAPRASAQLLAAKDGPIVYGHHHLVVSSVEDQKKFWVLEGATRVTIIRDIARRKAGTPNEAKSRIVRAKVLPADFGELERVILLARIHVRGTGVRSWGRSSRAPRRWSTSSWLRCPSEQSCRHWRPSLTSSGKTASTPDRCKSVAA